MIEIISGQVPTAIIDVNHYSVLWRDMYRNINSSTIIDYLKPHEIICAPNIEQMTACKQAVEPISADTILFFADYNTFYAGAFSTFSKLVNFSRWYASVDNLTECPVKLDKNLPHKTVLYLRVWLFKHNLKYKTVNF